MASNLMTFAVAVLCCCALGWGLGRGLRWIVSGADTALLARLTERLLGARPSTEPDPSTQILFCELELRRLAQLVQDTYDNDQPHKFERLQASRAAYDTALLRACALVDVGIPHSMPPLTPTKRLEAEMALVSAGVDW